MKVRKIFALSVLTTSMALAAGCSSDDDDDPEPTTEVPGTEEPGTEMPGTEMPGTEMPGTEMPGTEMPVEDTSTTMGNSIVDIARGTTDEAGTELTPPNAELTSLTDALAMYPDLINLLDADGTYTVFAPNNGAFDGVDLSTMDEATVRNILTYHVGTEVVDTSALSAEQTFPLTLATASEGNSLTLEDDGTGAISVTDSTGASTSIGTSVQADNGVVYIIDTLLMPPALPEEPVTEMPDGGDGSMGPVGTGGSTLAAIQDDEDLSQIAALVGDRAESLQATDDTNRAQILFAPRNDAIDAGATSILAYTVTASGDTPAGGPAASGTYMSFSDLSGDSAGTKQEFVLAGEGDSLTVNGLPAELVSTTSGPVLYVFGGEVEDTDTDAE